MGTHFPSSSRLPMGCRSAAYVDFSGGSTTVSSSSAAKCSGVRKPSAAFSGALLSMRAACGPPNLTSQRRNSLAGMVDQCGRGTAASPVLKSYTSFQLLTSGSSLAFAKCLACPGYHTFHRSKRIPDDVSTIGPSVCTNRSQCVVARVRSWWHAREIMQLVESRMKTDPSVGPMRIRQSLQRSMVTWLVTSRRSTSQLLRSSSSTFALFSSPS
mmetsp:Transcript_29501/g.74115  ORF Transcript_29501/g.74115 Transcript_29501/m.74115 type:complete len:213 (-) Transcript_29501:154-792(-)